MTDHLARALDEADEHDLSGRYGQAEDVLDRLIEATRAGGRSPDVLAAALVRRAALLRYAGDLDQAGVLLADATGIVDIDPAVGQIVACELHIELGRLLIETSGPDAAEVHLSRAVALAGSIDAERAQAIALATSLTAFGASKRLRGDYPAAETLLLEAVRSAEAAVEGDLQDRRAASELIHALDELGVLYKFSGEFQASEATYKRALELLMSVAGPAHPDVATIQHNLGGLAHARGDSAAAETFARRAVELHEGSLGADHLATVLDRSALAAILDQRGATAEAESLLRDCGERLERTLGPGHRELAVVLNNLAAIAQRAGRLDDAHDLYLRTAAIKERALGLDSPSLAITLNNLATVQRRQGRLDDAAANYARALDILVASAGADHPHVPLIQRNVARLEAARSDGMSDA